MLVYIAIFACAALMALIPSAEIETVSRLMAAAVGLLAAGLVPAMVATVNAMKGEYRSPKSVDELFDKLDSLLSVQLASMVLTGVVLVAIIAMTVITNAGLLIDLANMGIQAIVGALFGLLLSRLIKMGQAFRALLKVNRDHALMLSRTRTRQGRDELIDELRGHRFGPTDVKPRKLKKAV